MKTFKFKLIIRFLIFSERISIIKNKLLIIPGYIIGLACLSLITYRTVIAFSSESKAITIHINTFGELYFDLVALVIIWVICILGLIILFSFLKKEEIQKSFNYKIDRIPMVEKNYSFFEINKGIGTKIDNSDTTSYVAEKTSYTNKELKMEK